MSWAFGLGLGCCLVNVTTGRLCDMTAVERFIIKQLLPPMNDGIAYPVAGGQLINRSIYCFLFEMHNHEITNANAVKCELTVTVCAMPTPNSTKVSLIYIHDA